MASQVIEEMDRTRKVDRHRALAEALAVVLGRLATKEAQKVIEDVASTTDAFVLRDQVEAFKVLADWLDKEEAGKQVVFRNAPPAFTAVLRWAQQHLDGLEYVGFLCAVAVHS